MRNKRGFTLLELLIVMAILGVTIGFVGPRIYGGLSSSGMDKAARDITAIIQVARSNAITKHQTYLVRFDMDEVKVGYYLRPETSGIMPDMERERKLPEGIRFQSMKSPYQPTKQQGFFELRVTPDGIVEQGVIYLENALGKVYTLEVKPFSGYLKVEDRFVEKIYG